MLQVFISYTLIYCLLPILFYLPVYSASFPSLPVILSLPLYVWILFFFFYLARFLFFIFIFFPSLRPVYFLFALNCAIIYCCVDLFLARYSSYGVYTLYILSRYACGFLLVFFFLFSLVSSTFIFFLFIYLNCVNALAEEFHIYLTLSI